MNTIGVGFIFQFWYVSLVANFFTKAFTGTSLTVYTDNYDSISSFTLTLTSSICSSFSPSKALIWMSVMPDPMTVIDLEKVVWSGRMTSYSFSGSCPSIFAILASFFYPRNLLVVVFLRLISKPKSLVSTLQSHQIYLLKHPSIRIILKRNLMLPEAISSHSCRF